MFQYKSTVTTQQQGVLQEDVESVDVLRHLQTRHLWLQSRVALGHLKLDAVAGEKNPADTLTNARTQNPRVVRTCWSKMVALKHLQG